MTVAALETMLGDAGDPANPVGYAAVLAADERQEMLAEGERLLDRYQLNAEFVPVAYGGRLARADRLAEVLRAVWRRDPCLGLGYGFSSLIASVNIWCAGSEEHRRRAAGLLLANKRIAAAFHELAHGTDFASAECAARPVDGGWVLSGHKEIVTNLRRAEAMVLFARTGTAPSSRAYSQFLLVRDELPAGRLVDGARYPGTGMRGIELGGLTFDDCAVPGSALVGAEGHGIEVALRAYQITRIVSPALLVGPLDSALRLATEMAIERRLYGGAVSDLPYVRTTIARAYADLLTVDVFSAVGLRALHLLPHATAGYAPAVKYLTARIVLDAIDQLRSVLGAQGYLREGPYAMFQKLVRDAAPASFAHVSRAACLVMLLPHLPRLARRSWLVDGPPPDDLFNLYAELPPLDFSRLVSGMRGDPLTGVLQDPWDDGGPVGRFAGRFRRELEALRNACRELGPADITIDGSPAAFALADRYTILLAAAAALGVWRRTEGRLPRAALLAILDRLTDRLGGPAVLTVAEREHLEYQLFEMVADRVRTKRLLDLSARHLPG
jgi:alkylation response protein AidB-like acyl-CoA dehydrogenase